MAIFTTTQTGNINDGGTFGNTSPGVEGVDYPNLTGTDTVNISTGHTLTVNANAQFGANVSGTLRVATGVTFTHSANMVSFSWSQFPFCWRRLAQPLPNAL